MHLYSQNMVLIILAKLSRAPWGTKLRSRQSWRPANNGVSSVTVREKSRETGAVANYTVIAEIIKNTGFISCDVLRKVRYCCVDLKFTSFRGETGK